MYENTYIATQSVIALTAKDMMPPELEQVRNATITSLVA